MAPSSSLPRTFAMHTPSAVRKTRLWTILLAVIHPATFAATTLGSEQTISSPRKHSTGRRYVFTSEDASKQKACHASYRKPFKPTERSDAQTAEKIDNIFVDALARACCCFQHRVHPRPHFMTPVRSRYYTRQSGAIYRQQQRSMHSIVGSEIRPKGCFGEPSAKRRARQELALNMVDYYQFSEDYSPPTRWKDPLDGRTSLPCLIMPDISPSSKTKNGQHQKENSSESPVTPTEPELLPYAPAKENLDHLIKVLQDEDSFHEDAWDAYKELQAPRIIQLSSEQQHLLLRKMSTIERKSSKHLERYMSIVDEMEEHGIELNLAEHNSAIDLTAYKDNRVTVNGLEAALRAWKTMEKTSDFMANEVTFNILFDKATKAGKFALAETLWNEMQARDLELNRYSYGGLIFYFGLRGDGTGIRQAYRDYVDSGEIVDNALLNCVMSALFRAGESPAAMQVFERMKQNAIAASDSLVPYYDWKDERDIGRLLHAAFRQLRSISPRTLQELRDEQELVPNIQTFIVLIDHNVNETGELRQIANLLVDMHQCGIEMNNRVFAKIFKGFALHGGTPYTIWTINRLEGVYTAYLEALGAGLNGGSPDAWTILWAVRAFGKSANKARMRSAWDDLIYLWAPTLEQLRPLEEKLASLLREDL